MDKIKVAIIDEDLSWIKQTIDFLHKEKDVMVLWSAASKETAINHAKGEDVDIILMDNSFVSDKKNSGDIFAMNKAKIIMMAASADEEFIRNTFSAGMVNYILKKDYESLPVLIRLTYNQISPVEVIFKDYCKTKADLELSELTVTEKELYLLKKQGYSINQIALKTNRSEGTVRNLLSKVYKKLRDKR